MLTITVLAITVTGILSLTANLLRANRQNEEVATARQAIFNKVEEMHAATFTQMWTNYTSGGSPGNTFGVGGLEAPSAGGPHGNITFMSESESSAHWSTTADFNRDESTTSAAPSDGDEANKWIAFPISVSVSWGTATGDRTVYIKTIFYDRDL